MGSVQVTLYPMSYCMACCYMHDISWFFLLLYAFLYSVKSTSEVMYVMFIIFQIKDIAAYPTVQSGVRGWGYGI